MKKPDRPIDKLFTDLSWIDNVKRLEQALAVGEQEQKERDRHHRHTPRAIKMRAKRERLERERRAVMISRPIMFFTETPKFPLKKFYPRLLSREDVDTN